jgi:hypothetical protein
MREALGVVMVVVGIALGLYAGLWWAFIGGIVSIVEAVKATPVEAMGIALGIVRIMFAGLIGVVSAMLLVVPGAALASSK